MAKRQGPGVHAALARAHGMTKAKFRGFYQVRATRGWVGREIRVLVLPGHAGWGVELTIVVPSKGGIRGWAGARENNAIR